MDHTKSYRKIIYDQPDTRNEQKTSSERLIQGPESSNNMPKPSVLGMPYGTTRALKFSSQTGEEFSPEFLKPKVMHRRPYAPQHVPRDQIPSNGYIDDPRRLQKISSTKPESVPDARRLAIEHIYSKEAKKKEVTNETNNKCNQVLERAVSSPIIDTGSPRYLPRTISSPIFDSSAANMKILCSFGGKILPRPSDGKLRYVGGDTHILRIRKDILWRELKQKLAGLYKQVHTIKYQLPGEEIDSLISVCCDDDVQHMIDEYILFGDKELLKPRVLLFSSDCAYDIHFNPDNLKDYESQYVAAINCEEYAEASSCKENASISNLNQPVMRSVENGTKQSTLAADIVEAKIGSQGVSSKYPSGHNSFTFNPNLLSEFDTHPIYNQNRRNNCEGALSAISKDNNYLSEERGVTITSSMGTYYDSIAHSDIIYEPNDLRNLKSSNTSEGLDEGFSGMSEEQVKTVARMEVKSKGKSIEINQYAFVTGEKQQPPEENSGLSNDDANIVPSDVLHIAQIRGDQAGSPVHVLHIAQIRGDQEGSPIRRFESDELFDLQDVILHQQSSIDQDPFTRPVLLSQHKQQLPADANFYTAAKLPEMNPAMNIAYVLQQRRYQSGSTSASDTSQSLKSEYHHLSRSKSLAEENYHDSEEARVASEFSALYRKGDSPGQANNLKMNSESDHQVTANKNSMQSALASSNQFESSISNYETYMPAVSSEKIHVIRRNGTEVSSPNSGSGTTPRNKGSLISPSMDFEQQTTISDAFDLCIEFGHVGVGFQEKPSHSLSEPGDLLSGLDYLFHSYSFPKATESGQSLNLSSPVKNSISHGLQSLESSSSVRNTVQEEVDCETDTLEKHQQVIEVDQNISSFLVDEIPFTDTEEFLQPPSDAEELGTENGALQSDVDIQGLQIIQNEDLVELRELGSGTFGTVYHGRWRGTDVAIKRFNGSCFASQSYDKLNKHFRREAEILSKLHHPNIVAFYGIARDGPGRTIATVTEYMVNGSLKGVLRRKDKYLDHRKKLMIARDAAIGMEYLHSKNVIHYDLKCDNLLVNLRDQSKPICKVCDFGLARMNRSTMVSCATNNIRGTIPWMAPELLSGKKDSDEKIDVYSFGVVMWEILTGEEPYEDMHYATVIGGILTNSLRPKVPDFCDEDWRSLMEHCWAPQPEQRPTFTEIVRCLGAMYEAYQAKTTN